MKCDGYDGYEIATPDMVTTICLSLTQVIALAQVLT
jgi:hypothetical protein